VLGFDGQTRRLVVAEVVPRPEPIKEIEAEIAYSWRGNVEAARLAR